MTSGVVHQLSKLGCEQIGENCQDVIATLSSRQDQAFDD